MKDIKYIDLRKVEEIASDFGSIKIISKTLNIKMSVLRNALYYNYSIKNEKLKSQYIELAKAIRRGQNSYKMRQLE